MTTVRTTSGPAGRMMQSLRQPLARTTDFTYLFAIVVLLNLLGLLMVLSASSVTSLDQYGSSWYQFERQFVWLSIGCVALFLMSRFDYRRLPKYVPILLAISAGLMLLVMVPGLGVSVNGSARWLGYGMFKIQPSEFVKLAVILYVADLLSRRSDRIGEWRESIRPVMVVFGGFAVLLMLQPNLGTTIILASIVLVMMFVAGVPGKPLAIVSGGLVAGATLFAFIEPYRFRRLMAFVDPWADPLNTGFQTIQSQVGLANGGLFGTGLGQGRAKWGFLPEAHTDFIFAIIGEELGLLGAMFVVVLFLLFALFGVRTVLRTQDRFGMLIATGVTAWILVQAFINIGAVVGVLPITGVPLPFVSAGGSSLIVTMAAYGILLNVARQEH